MTQRAAVQGTIRSTPSSVARSTASGPRSPFGSACTSTNSGAGAGTSNRADTATRRPSGPAADDRALGDRALAVADAHLLARRQAQHVDRVPALVAVDQQLVASGSVVEQEQRGAVELGDAGVGRRHVSGR